MPDTQVQESIDRLKLHRRTQRAQLTKLFTRAENIIQHYDENDKIDSHNLLKSIHKQLSEKYEIHTSLEARILDLTEEDDFDTVSEASEDYMSRVYERKDRIYTFIENNQPVQSNNGSAAIDRTQHTRKSVALPKLQLQTFNGDILQWVSFYDLYNSSIHQDRNLDNIQKFSYLRSLLSGEASRTISGLALTDANYAHAVTLLKERYGQTHLLIDAHMTALWQIQHPTNDMNSLRHFYDTIESHVRGLQSLGKEEHSYGELLIPMIREKLPANIRQQIARERGDVAWDLPALRRSILREIKVLQAGYSIEELTITNIPSSPEITAAFHTHSTPSRTSTSRRQPNDITGRTQTSRQQPNYTPSRAPSRPRQPPRYKPMSPRCPFCEGDHRATECTVVKDTHKRSEIIRKNQQCFNCLGKHRISDCYSRFSCQICNRKHHTSLHVRENVTSPSETVPNNPQIESVQKSNVTVNHLNCNERTDRHEKPANVGPVLLKTAIVPISVDNNEPVDAVVMFDEGANATFISEKFARELSVTITKTENIQLATFGVNTTERREVEYTDIIAHELDGNKSTIKAMITPIITTHAADRIPTKVRNAEHLRDLKLAHPVSTTRRMDIDLLIGADQYWNYVGDHTVRGEIGPIAVSSKFGYLLSGPIGKLNKPAYNVNMMLNVTTPAQTEPPIHYLWDLEIIGIKDNPETEEPATMDYETYRDTHLTMKHGKYTAKLPWKEDHPPLPTNYDITVKRTRAMVRRIAPDVIKKYDEIIAEQRRRDFIEEVDDDDTRIGHYLSHRAVKKDSLTTPLRIVYDCSCQRDAKHPSLNDCLQTGPSLINDLPAILLRFRSNQIALTSDIEKAFLNVRLDPDDRKFTKFLWLTDINNPDSDFKVYRFKSVLFGAVCSPFILNAVIKSHLENNDVTPTAAQMSHNIYVDNIVDGARNETEAIAYYNQANELMSSSGFKLRAWSSNNDKVNALAKRDDVNESANNVSILGIRWKADTDELTYSNTSKPILADLITKRDVVSYTASLYDPIGFLSPVLIRAKLFIQHLWKLSVAWDEPLSAELSIQWVDIAEDLREARNINVKRQYFTHNDPQDKIDIHTFADASPLGYGAIVYITHSRETAFVMAKTRVAPMTDTTLPRLELMAVLIASRLTKFVMSALSDKYNFNNCYLWSDSQIVLHWLNSEKKLPKFVRNRVEEINELSFTYKYVPTAVNPADLLTRGITCDELNKSQSWWHGPSWLTTPTDWPTCDMFDVTVLQTSLGKDSSENNNFLHDQESITDEVIDTSGDIGQHKVGQHKGSITTEVIDTPGEIGLHKVVDITRFGSIDKLLRVTAYVLRFISRLKKSDTINDVSITPTELKQVERRWILDVQRQKYSDSIHDLKTKHTKLGPLVHQLGLFIDEDDVVRCGSRIHNAQLEFVTKFPILLPSNHELTKLIVLKAHALIQHGGVQSTVTQIRQHYWIPRIRQIVSSILRGCVTCRRIDGRPYANPIQAPLPSYRVNILPAFTITGVDFTGFLLTKAPDGTRGKAYVCLFTCAVTRAIHLELVPDLSTRTFLHAFRRFAARRSLPSRMLSDNASTYLSAAQEIRTLFDTPEIREYLATHRVQWTFIPKRAPWFGGFWERLIGLTKSTIKKTLGRALISFDELSTVITEIETALNDRPLTYVSSDLKDKVGLTPNHLLHGRQVTSLPYITVSDEEINDPSYYPQHEAINDRYEHLSRLHVQFWKRWSNEYLTALRERHAPSGSKHNVIQVGDVVIVHSDIDKRLNWQLGTVTKLVYGNDKLVRSAELITANGPTNRPINKLYPLEVVSREFGENTTQTTNDDDSTQSMDHVTSQATDTTIRRSSRDASVAARLRIADLK